MGTPLIDNNQAAKLPVSIEFLFTKNLPSSRPEACMLSATSMTEALPFYCHRSDNNNYYYISLPLF